MSDPTTCDIAKLLQQAKDIDAFTAEVTEQNGVLGDIAAEHVSSGTARNLRLAAAEIWYWRELAKPDAKWFWGHDDIIDGLKEYLSTGKGLPWKATKEDVLTVIARCLREGAIQL